MTDKDQREYKYHREDFGHLPVTLNHLTLHINFVGDGTVCAVNRLDMTAKGEVREIALDTMDLEIKGIELCEGMDAEGNEGATTPLKYSYDRKADKVRVTLPTPLNDGTRFHIEATSISVPSDHILEGIYRDATPEGAPQQYISQCQQWGFQRIMPIFDDCRAKCTMTTTIEADSAYTDLISNGDICKDRNPGGVPVPKEGDESRQVITYINPIPMSPYLFFVGAGTWDTLSDSVTYPSGRTVNLKYLVPPGLIDDARVPMEILKESVLWIERTQGYEYTFDTYRTICMTKSNFGGMENLGNTTIVTDAALITEHTLDTMLLYAHGVIVHEFEHNQCGSETTMDTPFDVWLNEAYTVDVERQFMADLFNSDFARLNQVDGVRNPLLGPLAIEDAGHFGRIVREGFNEPDELIDGVTYVKAAEVIRMLRLLIGEERFHMAKVLYFSRYRLGNADTDQFFACFEEVMEGSVKSLDLDNFKKEWLYRIGYPKVSATTAYDRDKERYTVNFTQELEEGKSPFTLPISLGLVDKTGTDIKGTTTVFNLSKEEDKITFEGITEEPLIASMNRDFSFYGTFTHTNIDDRGLRDQCLLDPNSYNRVDAMRKLTDKVRIGIIDTLGDSLSTGKLPTSPPEVSSNWLDLYGELLGDTTLDPALKSFFLRIDEQPVNREYGTFYQELVAAKEEMMRAVNGRFRDILLDEFKSLTPPEGIENMREAIEVRMLKNTLLALITVDDSEESHGLLIDYFKASTNPTDRVAALTLLNRSSAPKRREILEDVYSDWHSHLSGYANYLRVVSSGTCKDVFDMIREERERESFDITQPTWNRALFLSMAMNNKMVWTDEGIEWVAGTVIELAPVNTTTAGRLLNTFQNVHKLKPALSGKVIKALKRITKEVNPKVSASIHGQGIAYLG